MKIYKITCKEDKLALFKKEPTAEHHIEELRDMDYPFYVSSEETNNGTYINWAEQEIELHYKDPFLY